MFALYAYALHCSNWCILGFKKGKTLAWRKPKILTLLAAKTTVVWNTNGHPEEGTIMTGVGRTLSFIVLWTSNIKHLSPQNVIFHAMPILDQQAWVYHLNIQGQNKMNETWALLMSSIFVEKIDILVSYFPPAPWITPLGSLLSIISWTDARTDARTDNILTHSTIVKP